MNSQVTAGIFFLVVIPLIILAVISATKLRAKNQYATWQNQVAGLTEMVESLKKNETPAVTMALQKGEIPLARIPVQLMEYRSTGSSYQGGSQGVSIRVMKGVSFRVGANRGQLVRNPAALTIVDSGDATFTNQRVVFGGSIESREWDLDKMIDFDTTDNGTRVMISVSNRQKVSGLQAIDLSVITPGILTSISLELFNKGQQGAIAAAQNYLEQFKALEPANPEAAAPSK